MKIFAAAFLIVSSAISASAFTTVGPASVGSALRMTDSPDPIDKSLRGIDAEGSYDPTVGEKAALTRNNNDEVWVQQVKFLFMIIFVSCHHNRRSEILIWLPSSKLFTIFLASTPSSQPQVGNDQRNGS